MQHPFLWLMAVRLTHVKDQPRTPPVHVAFVIALHLLWTSGRRLFGDEAGNKPLASAAVFALSLLWAIWALRRIARVEAALKRGEPAPPLLPPRRPAPPRRVKPLPAPAFAPPKPLFGQRR